MSDLEPAQYEEQERRAFAPKTPWRWIFAIAGGLAFIAGYYNWRERSKAAATQSGIEASHRAHVVPVRERVNTFRERIESWVIEAAAEAPETWAHPQLNLAGLHRAQGIYLRIHASEAIDAASIMNAARGMDPDAITRCLGLSPTSLKGFYDRVEYLAPEWLEEVEAAADDNLRLRMYEEQLRVRVERDLPLMLDSARSDYFLLVVQHGDNRRAHPVDVFLWDLRRGEALLRTRTRARGALIPVRVALGNTPAGTARPPAQRSGVTDCSIASQVRAAAGQDAATVQNEMPAGPVLTPESESDADSESESEGTDSEHTDSESESAEAEADDSSESESPSEADDSNSESASEEHDSNSESESPPESG